MNWSPAQARMLEAMGYEPMQARGDWGAFAGASRATGGAPARPPVPRAAPPAEARPQAEAMPLARATSPAPARAADAPARAVFDGTALAAALRRAAGGRDVAALAGDLGRLRGDPAAKRALWPSLRALRRSQ